MARPVAVLVGTLFLFVAGAGIYANRAAFVQGNSSARDVIDRVRAQTPDDAVLVVSWMYATPLAYGAYVEHRLGNRIVLTGWPEDYTQADYRRWLAKRPVIVLSDDSFQRISGFDLRALDEVIGPSLFSMRPRK